MTSLHVVIRSAGERTASVARRLADAQSSVGDITNVEAAPLEEALRQMFKAGVAAGRKWTMALDADVLLRPGAIADLLAEAEALPENYVLVQGRVFDKVSLLYRHAGNRIYRTAYLPQLLELVPPNGAQLRPETFVAEAFGRRGHRQRYAGVVVGLHDFEQFYVDLYRKAVVHSRKMMPYADILGGMLRGMVEGKNTDTDYEVTLRAFCDGLQYDGAIAVDRHLFSGMAVRALQDMDLEEKMPIADEERFLCDVAGLLDEVARRYPILDMRPRDEPAMPVDKRFLARVRERLASRGAVGGVRSIVGAALRRIGSQLEA